jgi:hypothetical protein
MPDDVPQDYEMLKSLGLLAVRMRRAQIEYFASKNYASLARARELERHFDQHAREIFGNAGEVHQPGSQERLL